jgi:sulfatase maturation enzyme AslB (radical SAM superfamily)
MMIERHPDWFTSHFLVTMTLTPENLPHLAESVAYLLEKNVETIGISPALSRVPGWNDDVMDELDVQMSRIFQLGKRIFQKSGKVPFLPFRKYSDNELPVGQKQRTCAALESRSPVLDVDGTLYSCLMFAPSGLDSCDRRLVEITQDTIFGKVGSPDLEERRREFSSGIRNRDVFSSAPDLESIYGKCSECPAAALCKICPLSLLEFSSGPAPKAVPALLCAYYYLIMKYSRMFPVQDDPSPPRVTPESIRARMRHWNKVHEKIPGS